MAPTRNKTHWHLVHRCKYCQRRFLGYNCQRFNIHICSHERNIKPYWYKKTSTKHPNADRNPERMSAQLQVVEGKLSTNVETSHRRTRSKSKALGNADSIMDISKDLDHCVDSGLPLPVSDINNAKVKHSIRRYCDNTCQPTARTTATNMTKKAGKKVPFKKRYHCRFCPRCFSQNGGLVIHERIHRGDKPFVCDICDIAFYDKSNLRKHHRIHTGDKVYKCKYCGNAFSDPSGLKKHESAHNASASFKCTYCDITFKCMQSRRSHERNHTGEKPYPCKYCSKAFSRSGDRNSHEGIHTGERPHKCDFEGCNAAYIRAYPLTVHKRTHTGEKYVCEFCDWSFRETSKRNLHQKRQCPLNPMADRASIHNNKCSFCVIDLTAMTTHYSRGKHEIIHTGETPYVCNWCLKRFKRLRHVKRNDKIDSR